MNKENKITDEEKNLFRQAVKKIKPNSLKSQSKVSSEEEVVSSIDLDHLPDDAWVDSEEMISFHRAGLQNQILKKISQGKLPIEARLDLHGMIVAEALQTANTFLFDSAQHGTRFVLIVHGKGAKRPILKNALNQWLRIHPHVSAFHSATARHGGAGALYVLIC